MKVMIGRGKKYVCTQKAKWDEVTHRFLSK